MELTKLNEVDILD